MATEHCDKVAAGADPGLSLSGKSYGRGPALFCNSSVPGLSFLQFICARSLAFLQFIWHGNRHSRGLQGIFARAMAPICVHRAPRSPPDSTPGHIDSLDVLQEDHRRFPTCQKICQEDLAGLKNSTIEKKLGYLRWFLNWATDRGYNTNLDYKKFHPTLKMTQRKVIYLTKEEIARVRDLELSEAQAYLDPIRDIFLFCCFSGLRHSDVNILRRSDVKGDHIEVTTVKTADSISIELNKVIRDILEKYKDTPFKDNKALPNYTNNAMNRDIKELCKLAGINEEIRVTTYKGNVRTDKIQPKWELVGTHTGRRTFIVNALSLGITPNIVMKWTGRSDYKAMKPYIDIVDSIKASEMTKFDGLI